MKNDITIGSMQNNLQFTHFDSLCVPHYVRSLCNEYALYPLQRGHSLKLACAFLLDWLNAMLSCLRMFLASGPSHAFPSSFWRPSTFGGLFLICNVTLVVLALATQRALRLLSLFHAHLYMQKIL